ncbi:hypothetical protein T4B_6122 [Trichinella pseudospiralis]|uniref:Uncharacterized protein n=1 Tax=Trichinella pseudospiralis TaxID=6337 RepID=A0A0V1IZL5_TRIPS|nr:hypothetical protein T4B_6122 [Trichinella pseudospiralis]KRZ33677.1 hypothetical protein T4C_3793 [Trichinella pseudospiralis]
MKPIFYQADSDSPATVNDQVIKQLTNSSKYCFLLVKNSTVFSSVQFSSVFSAASNINPEQF